MAGPFPIPKFYFAVDMWGTEISFKEVSGLSQEYEQMEYRAGDSEGFYTEKRNGLTKASPVTFKKGIFSGDTDLTDIVNNAGPTEGDRETFWADGEPEDITINLKNEKGDDIVTWILHRCVPTKMSFSDMASDSSEVAIEEMELTYAVMEFEIA